MTVQARPDRLVTPSRLRAAVARVTSASACVPQFTVERDVDLTGVQALRRAAREQGAVVSVTDVLTAAVARALLRHPRVNASWTTEGIREHGAVNVGLVVAVPDGLVAPAILDADRLDLADLAARRQQLVAGATAGTLGPAELMSATFTISNLGPFGVSRFHALVLPPQAAILAVGAASPAGVVTLALSCDHRVLDGAPAAAFLGDLAEQLARPDELRCPAGGAAA